MVEATKDGRLENLESDKEEMGTVRERERGLRVIAKISIENNYGVKILTETFWVHAAH